MYCGITEVPESFAEGKGDMLTYCDDCAFWTFNKVTNFAYLRYDLMSKDIKKLQDELENRFINNTPIVDASAKELYAQDPKLAIQYLTDYSVNTGNYLVNRWEKLFQYLLVKYMDGNVKQEENGKFKYNEYNAAPAPVKNPQYPDWWKKNVIDATGDKLLQPANAGGH